MVFAVTVYVSTGPAGQTVGDLGLKAGLVESRNSWLGIELPYPKIVHWVRLLSKFPQLGNAVVKKL